MGGLDEARQNHAVLTGLAGANGVEKAGDDDGSLVLLGMGEGQKLVHELGAGITPPAQVRRADEEIILLGKSRLAALAIDLGGGGEQNGHLFGAGRVQDQLRFAQVGFDGPETGTHDQLHADAGGQMINGAGFGRQIRQSAVFGDLRFNDDQVRVEAGRPQILQTAGGKVIEHGDGMAVGQKAFDQMGADEAGAAGDEDVGFDAHGGPIVRESGMDTSMNGGGQAFLLEFILPSDGRHPRLRINGQQVQSIELIQFPWSPFCLVQRRILEYSNVPFKITNVANHDRSLVWRLTRHRYYGVPIIRDGRTVVFETG